MRVGVCVCCLLRLCLSGVPLPPLPTVMTSPTTPMRMGRRSQVKATSLRMVTVTGRRMPRRMMVRYSGVCCMSAEAPCVCVCVCPPSSRWRG